MDEIDLQAFLGLLILAGVYRSQCEAAASPWDAESGSANLLSFTATQDCYDLMTVSQDQQDV